MNPLLILGVALGVYYMMDGDEDKKPVKEKLTEEAKGEEPEEDEKPTKEV